MYVYPTLEIKPCYQVGTSYVVYPTLEIKPGYQVGYSLCIVSRSQTVTFAVTVWTTAVERFVLSSPGSRVGDKCEQYRKGHESHYLLAKVYIA